jgi:transcriptional regulator GlxA family with amidase domain
MSRRSPRHVAMVAFPDAQILDVVGPLEVFSRASRVVTDEGRRGTPPYRVEILARAAGPVVMSSSLAVVAGRAYGSVRERIDTLMVAGGRGVDAALGDRALIRWLRRAAPRARRVASVCTGAFLLAEAGLLDGKTVTTHWSRAAALAERYPRLAVDPEPIFVAQGRIFTSAGVTAGMDLALALVEQDHGRELAARVARELVLFLKRPGGQAQFSEQLQTQLSDREPIADLQAWMADHPAADLSVAALARRAAMSPRNFARVFARTVGVTPAEHVERVRIEAARRRLEESNANVDEIASQCGFGTRESLRRAFHRALKVSPTAYRSRFAQRTEEGTCARYSQS